MSKLADALKYKYGAVADTVGNEITAWRHETLPKPTEEEKAQAIQEYENGIVEEKNNRKQRKNNVAKKLGLTKAEIKALKELLEDGTDD